MTHFVFILVILCRCFSIIVLPTVHICLCAIFCYLVIKNIVSNLQYLQVFLGWLWLINIGWAYFAPPFHMSIFLYCCCVSHSIIMLIIILKVGILFLFFPCLTPLNNFCKAWLINGIFFQILKYGKVFMYSSYMKHNLAGYRLCVWKSLSFYNLNMPFHFLHLYMVCDEKSDESLVVLLLNVTFFFSLAACSIVLLFLTLDSFTIICLCVSLWI